MQKYLLTKPSRIVLWILLLPILIAGCSNETAPLLEAAYQPGSVTRVEDAYGVFYAYVPQKLPPGSNILVLIHGTPAKEESAEETAKYYIDSWLDFAETQRIVLLALSFNQRDFSSRQGEIEDSLTGYRGLFGREIGADDWVLRITSAYQQTLWKTEGKFSLYGHSAGGQFVARFLVSHPEIVDAAAITAAATYPQPDASIAWPFGMGELHTEIEWDENTFRREDVVPDKQKWLAATQIPLTVIVGMNDTESQPKRPGQSGADRISIANNWVQNMRSFAEENSLESNFALEVIPGKGHSMSGLLEYSQRAMIDVSD